jgi:hypothetical protein
MKFAYRCKTISRVEKGWGIAVNSLWYPVLVPQMTGGLRPVSPETIKLQQD